MASKFLQKFSTLEEYLKSKQAIKLLQRLPFGWFHEDAIKATKERIEMIQKTVKSANFNNLSKWLILTVPGYNFFYILASLSPTINALNNILPPSEDKETKLDRMTHSTLAGSEDIYRILKDTAENGYDVETINEFCKKSPRIKEIDKFIDKQRSDIMNQPMSVQEQNEKVEKAKKIYKTWKPLAKIDFKIGIAIDVKTIDLQINPDGHLYQ